MTRSASAWSASRRWGYSLVEALVGVILLALVLQAAWTVVSAHARAGMDVIRRSELMETARIGGWVLRRELHAGAHGRDWEAADDSIRLRAFRAVAIPCDSGSAPAALHVVVRGMRSVDPAKDSVLLLWPDGTWRVHGLERRTAGPGCGPDGPHTEVWTLDSPGAGGILARVFESGSYHVADGALRYRRGGGGRQPLTPTALGSGAWLRRSGAGVELRLEPTVRPTPAWEPVLRFWGAPGSGPP